MQFKIVAKKFFSNLIVIEIGLIILILFFGSLLFYLIEHHCFLDSLYFMAMTMTTIGFGDITPQTDIGKVLVIVYSFMGVPLFVSLSGLILESRFNKTIKGYISRVHKEVHAAEEEIKLMEEKVSKEIQIALGDSQEQAEDTQEQIEKIEKVINKQQYWRNKIFKK